jgi:uncharacterized protein (TIGR02996 family)
MNTPDDAFLQEIQSDPEDVVPRLVYADWLEENGDPLADLIRVQCQLADLSVDSPDRGELVQRERVLLIEHHEKIVQPLQKFSPHALSVNRGFVESIRLDADVLIRHADEIVRLLPGLCSLTIRKSGKSMDDLVKLPQLQHVKSLSLGMAGLRDDGLQKLLSSPHWSGLVELNLRGNDLTVVGLLETDRTFRTLILNRNGIGKSAAAQLGRANATSKLQHLEISGNSVRVAGVKSLLAAEGLPEIQYLAAASQGTLIGDGRVGISPKGTSSSPRFLNLSGNGITDRALPGLLRSGIFARTVDLNLRRNNLTDDSLLVLLDSEHTPQLRRLHLAGNKFSNWTLSDLAKSPKLRQVERITLDRSMMTRCESFQEFFESPNRNPYVQLAVPTERGPNRTEIRKTMIDQIVSQLGEDVRPMLEIV